MRGKAGTESSTPTSARITPAYAGKRNGQSPTMLLRRDHPRVCGEKWPAALYEEMERGITPAYAGKRPALVICVHSREDHPRVCGEKCVVEDFIAPPAGSPPRMRGKGTFGGCGAGPCGITPAYAGKSSPAGNCRSVWWDHPRVCGEKPERKAPRRPRLGSPPRMRGKETDSRRQCCSAGITPAYAGKRTLFCLAGRRNRDHPRVCGEKSMYSGVFYERYRITPAYAGKSFPAGCPRSRSRDHPRVCGEKPRRPPAAAVGIGSPPRMRGKDSIMDGLQGVHGITPAYAGKRR